VDLNQLQFEFRSAFFRNRPQLCHVRRTVEVLRLMVLNRRGKRDERRENVGVVRPMGSMLITASSSEKRAGRAEGYAWGQLATALLAALAQTAVSITMTT
jgi:hypothetical protein